MLPELLKRGTCEEGGSAPPPVAIVDPPRAGLHHKAVQALRSSPNLRRLVYVACDAKAAYQRYVIYILVESESYLTTPSTYKYNVSSSDAMKLNRVFKNSLQK